MNTNASIYDQLMLSLKTTEEVADFTYKIDTLTATFFKTEPVSTENALSAIGKSFSEKIIQALFENNIDPNNKVAVINFFDALKESIKKLKTIKLVLAFDPGSKTIEKLYNFIRETVGQGYILDIEVAKEILGGAIIIFNGKYRDFTLKKNIEDAFKTKDFQLSINNFQ